MKEENQKAFDTFWKEYWPKCRRIDKKKAADQWARIRPERYPVILAALERQKKQPSWNTGDCKFIPYPHRWLRDQRWEDEITLPEDEDAEILIAALQQHAVCPADFPKHILARFFKMAGRMKTNWTRIHVQLSAMPHLVNEIRGKYLAEE